MGSLLLRGYRWEQAAALYRTLLQQDSRRLDFQSGLLLALWQGKRQDEAYDLARRSRRRSPSCLWRGSSSTTPATSTTRRLRATPSARWTRTAITSAARWR